MRKKHIFLLILIVVLIVSVLTGCKATSKYNTEILTGNSFEYEEMSKLTEDWTLASGGTNSSVFSLVDSAVKIDTSSSSAGYASISQTAYLKTNSYYKITYSFSSSSFSSVEESGQYVGFYVGFPENIAFNRGDDPIEHRGSTSKRTVTYYFKTGMINEVNLTMYVGSKDHPVSVSNVTVYDISLQRVQKATAVNGSQDKEIMVLTKDIYGRASILNTTLIVLGVVLTAVLAYAGYYAISRFLSYKNNDGKGNAFIEFLSKNKNGILCAIGIALIIRLLVAVIGAISAQVAAVKFLGFDVENILKQGKWMVDYGMPYFFKYNPEVTFNPLSLSLTSFVGLVSGGNLIWGAFVIKLFAIAADIGVIIIIFKLGEKKLGTVGSTILASVYSLVPVTFAMSAKYGSWESITVLLLVLTFYFILEKDLIRMSISYFVAILFNALAWYLLPIVLMFVIYQIIKDKNARIIAPVGLVIGFVAYFIISLPFTVVKVGEGKIFHCFSLFIQSAKGLSVYTANAFNFQGLLSNNFAEISIESQFITILFTVFAIALIAFGYFKNKNRMDLLLLGACFMTVLFMFTNNMLPYSLYIVLPLLMMYVASTKEKRIFAVFVMLAATMFINNVYVYSISGYTDAGVNMLTKADSIIYWISAINLIITCYFIYVVFDIVASKKFVTINKMDIPYFKYMELKFKNLKISIHNFNQKVKARFVKKPKTVKNEDKNKEDK